MSLGCCFRRKNKSSIYSDSWNKKSERPSMQTMSPERRQPRSDEIALSSVESRNHTSSTLTRDNDLLIDVYHNESEMTDNPNWKHNSRMYATHCSNRPVHARTHRQGNGYYASVDKNRSAIELMKQHYVDKIYELQLERSGMKIALAKTVKENQNMKRLLQIRNILDHDNLDVSKTYRTKLGKYDREAVKMERAHKMLSYRLDDTCHRLSQTKKDANIKLKDLEREIKQLETENYYLRERIEIEINNSKLALFENESLKHHLHSTGNDLECCKSKSQQEKYTPFQLHESEIDSLRRIEQDKQARLQKLDHNLRAQFETNISNIQLEKHKLEVYIADLESKLDQMKKGYESDCNAMQNMLHRKENELKEMELELENSKRRMQKKSEEERKLRSENVDLRTKLGNEARSVKWNQSQTEKRIDELSKENKELKSYIDQQKYTFENQLKEAIESNNLRQRLGSSEMGLENANIKLHQCQTDLQSARETNAYYEKQSESKISKFQQNANEYETSKAHLQKENSELNADIIQLRKENDQLKRQKHDYKTRHLEDYDAQQHKLHHTEKIFKETKLELESMRTSLQKDTLSSKKLYDSKIANLLQEKNGLEACKADLEKKNDQMTIDITTLQQRLDSDEKRRPTFADYDALQQKLHRAEKDLKQTKQELEDTKTSLQKDTLSSKKLYDSKIANLLQEKNGLEACKADLEKKNDQMTIDITTLQQRLDSDEKRRPTFADYDALQQKLHRAEKDLKQTKQELEDTKTSLQKDALSSKKLFDSKIANLLLVKNGLEACNADLEKKNDQMTTDIKNLRYRLESDQRRGYAFAEDDALQQKLHRTENELKQTELELEDTKTRLSKCMGDKLTNNNPNIVDLSDMNRPSKLADRYKELYDNQWTDAYEILEDTEKEEERIIYILLAILIETKRFCDEENRIQMEETLKAITHSDKMQIADIPVGVIKYIKDCRKSSSAQDIKIKYEKYISEMRKGSFSLAKQALAINEYLNECFEICWLMSIQDPPVVLSPLLKHGVSFRTDLYCAYTVSGKLVDYIVWPALLLHENGPTLTKGVAQGMKRA